MLTLKYYTKSNDDFFYLNLKLIYLLYFTVFIYDNKQKNIQAITLKNEPLPYIKTKFKKPIVT